MIIHLVLLFYNVAIFICLIVSFQCNRSLLYWIYNPFVEIMHKGYLIVDNCYSPYFQKVFLYRDGFIIWKND